jgi:nucleoside-diphosphate-sugar epimerase
MKVLVTGASGFIGRAVADRLHQEPGVSVRGAHRGNLDPRDGVEGVVVEGLTESAHWSEALRGCHAVVHAAARVHVMRDAAADPLAEYRAVNVAGTLRLAHQAVQAGASRFVFISSIKVNGEQTPSTGRYTAEDVPAPADPYGVSKREAEVGLRRLARETGLEVVIIRPVLVYGPGVKGNFRTLMRWLYRGLPLPLGAIRNQRSLVALENLVDLVVRCLTHSAAANETFLVSDDEDLSTTELVRRMAAALGRPARLIPVPASVLGAAFRMLGKRDVANRLCASLRVDISKTRALLDWAPPLHVDEALARTAADYLGQEGR